MIQTLNNVCSFCYSELLLGCGRDNVQRETFCSLILSISCRRSLSVFFLLTIEKGLRSFFFLHYGDCAYDNVYVDKLEIYFQWPQFTSVPWPEYLVTTGSIPDLSF
jgi:hypothetical protein